MDAWHKLLIAAVTALCGVIAALWRHAIVTRREQDAKDLAHEETLSKLHAEHKADIRELTQAALELGTAVTARVLPPSGSENSRGS